MKEKRVLKVHMFNVGQGDHFLLELPNGEFGLIDFYYDVKLGYKEPPALTYLKSVPNPVISFVAISHPDGDHLKGLGDFLKWTHSARVPIKNIWVFSGAHINDIIDDYQTAYSESPSDLVSKYATESLTTDLFELHRFTSRNEKNVVFVADQSPLAKVDSVTSVVALGPLARHVKECDREARVQAFKLIIKQRKPSSRKKNILSALLLINCGNFKLLFTGDSPRRQIRESLAECDRRGNDQYWGAVVCDFVKAPHHGSFGSSSKPFWKRVLSGNKKSIIAVSAGRHGRYRHPNSKTIRQISDVGTSLGTPFHILATNVCADCLATESFNSNEAVWISTPILKLSPETNRGLDNIRAKTKIRSLPALVAYSICFDLDQNEATISRQTGIPSNCHTTCIFGAKRPPSFPGCVA